MGVQCRWYGGVVIVNNILALKFSLFILHSIVKLKTKSSKIKMSAIGWIFFLLFIGFLVYFLGGIFILKSRGASGIEMIPNYTFWIALPKRAKDGFDYLMNGCKPREDSYEAI